MASVIPELIVEKPSKALNVSYVIFGYVLSSYLLYPIDLDVVGKIISTVIVGGVLGTLLYYVRPIDRAISLILKSRLVQKKNFGGGDLNLAVSFTPSSVLNSPMLAEQKAKVNGAIFLAVSILLSGSLFTLVNITLPFWITIPSFGLVFGIALWESGSLILKTKTVGEYYVLSCYQKSIATEIGKAISANDWLRAKGLVARTKKYTADGNYGGGICPECKSIEEFGNYCTICGKPLTFKCAYCGAILSEFTLGKETKFCRNCGKKIE